MNVVEVKNNLVKVKYNAEEHNLVLSGFVLIRDTSQSFIAQVIHLEANQNGTFAIAKMLFNFDPTGVISGYNGSLPDMDSIMDIVRPEELLEIIPIQNPLFLGELAQQKTLLNVDRLLLEDKLLVCSEKQDDNELLTKNLVTQLLHDNKKVLIFDLQGGLDFSNKKLTAGKDFKLPLNYETINFIYEKGLDDAKAETKALIQDIFLEVQEYVKTLDDKFIPFESFKDVVDSQYQELGIVELVLLKNKLLKYYEAGIFAQTKEEFESLEKSLSQNKKTIFDLSEMSEKVQREIISYTYSLIGNSNEQIYVFLNISDEISDKKLLKQIFNTKQAFTTLFSSYTYKYLKELKQLSKNLLLFAPIQQQNDFAGYNVFLSKLNAHEFVVYGNTTQHLPLIVRLEDITKHKPELLEEKAESPVPEQISQPESAQEIFEPQIQEEEEIEILTSQNAQSGPQLENEEEFTTIVTDDLTDEDLDLIDNFGEINSQPPVQKISVAEETSLEGFSTPQFEEYETTSNVISNEPVQEFDPPQSDIEIIEEESGFSKELKQQEREAQLPPQSDILPVQMASTPIVPLYSADIEKQADSDEIEQGDVVVHPKYGKGHVEKLISYGSKTLCSINFDNVGRRLLDPTLAEIKKV